MEDIENVEEEHYKILVITGGLETRRQTVLPAPNPKSDSTAAPTMVLWNGKAKVLRYAEPVLQHHSGCAHHWTLQNQLGKENAQI